MKKLKALVLICLIFLSSGCFKRDTLEDINVSTTVYPLEFVMKSLYGEHSTIHSVYPDDTDSFSYTLTNKQVDDASGRDLFIYNGSTSDKDMAFEFTTKNNDLLIIDASYGIDVSYHDAELWLNPSNLLMISQNIKNGLKEYITNSYLKKEIDQNYEELKVDLSELDAELRLTANNASKKTVVVNSDALLFLEKYGFDVISLDDTTTLVTDKQAADVKELITSQQVKNIFLLQYEKNSDILNQIITETKVSTLTFKRIDTITDSERENGQDYISLMMENIELLKKELYE